MSTVDASSLAAAKAAAARTGVPQPVHDTTGKILYYVDWQGAVVPAVIAQDQIERATQTAEDRRRRDQDNGVLNSQGGLNTQAEREAAQAGQAEAGQTARAKAAVKLATANEARGWVWVNGQLSQIVGFDAHGQPIVHYAGGGLQTVGKTGTLTRDPTQPDVATENGQPGGPTAFGALSSLYGSSNLDGSAMFNLSTGPANIFTGVTNAGDGFTPGPTYGADRPGNTNFAAAEHGEAANTVTGKIYDQAGNMVGQAPVQNKMTVADGVQWFLNLSVQHPDQYKQLVDELVAAHYISPNYGQNAGGGYSSDAALGFAKAAIDLGQVNSTKGGEGIGLYDWLKQKSAAAQQYAESQVQPVNRAYQDPATLQYAARNAAQQVLGRNLTPAEEQAFEAAFRGKENAYYDGIDASNRAQAGAALMNSTAPGAAGSQPDATGEAEQFTRGDQFANQRAGYSMLEYLKAFQSMLGSGNL